MLDSIFYFHFKHLIHSPKGLCISFSLIYFSILHFFPHAQSGTLFQAEIQGPTKELGATFFPIIGYVQFTLFLFISDLIRSDQIRSEKISSDQISSDHAYI